LYLRPSRGFLFLGYGKDFSQITLSVSNLIRVENKTPYLSKIELLRLIEETEHRKIDVTSDVSLMDFFAERMLKRLLT
jgi:hypothetical protein